MYLYSSDDDSFDEFVNGTKFITTYSETDDTNTKTSLTTTETTAFGNMAKTVYTDAFGRTIKEQTKNGDTVVLTKEYTYNSNGDYVTDQILTEKVTVGSTTYLYNQYSYDNNGNITVVKNLHSAGVQETYEYDELGQLVKENSTSFEYDNYGNITKKGIYSYSYEDENWKDRLTSRGNKTITYDEVGNPLNYMGATLTWKNGRQLASYVKGNLSLNYEYNEYGLRTQKVVNDNGTITTYNYTWTDDKLTHQAWDNNYLHFYYDYSDEIVGFEYFDGTDTKCYTYLKNMQGDVFGIADEEGNVVAQYTYDAWGRLKSATSGIGLINPIRYRGYYYDTEISMYYLQSRYYDQNVGRFISADDTDYIGYTETMLSYNIFTYCENNCVNKYDYLGTDAMFIYAPIKKFGIEHGHSAIMFKDSNGWYYFSDNGKNKTAEYETDFDFRYLGSWFYFKYGEELSDNYYEAQWQLENPPKKISKNKRINLLHNRLKQLGKKTIKINGEKVENPYYVCGLTLDTTLYQKPGYYIKGNFSSLYNYINNTLMKTKHHTIFNNCLNYSCNALLKGTFTGKYAKEIRKAYNYANGCIAPVKANYALWYFYLTYKDYFSASISQQSYLTDPYFYFYN